MLVAITSLHEGKFLSKWVKMYTWLLAHPFTNACVLFLWHHAWHVLAVWRVEAYRLCPAVFPWGREWLERKGLWNLFFPVGRQKPGRILRIYRNEPQRWAMPNLFLICFPGPSCIHWSNLWWTTIYSCLCLRHWSVWNKGSICQLHEAC